MEELGMVNVGGEDDGFAKVVATFQFLNFR